MQHFAIAAADAAYGYCSCCSNNRIEIEIMWLRLLHCNLQGITVAIHPCRVQYIEKNVTLYLIQFHRQDFFYFGYQYTCLFCQAI